MKRSRRGRKKEAKWKILRRKLRESRGKDREAPPKLHCII